ncbi:MAG: hypothetical protein DMG09_12955, partial [Acidobacteria bacterium]
MFRRLAVLLSVLLSSALFAQTYDQALFSGMKWRGIGPYRGGRVLAVTGVSGDPNTFYFGGVAGGVWKTTERSEHLLFRRRRRRRVEDYG